MTTTKSAALYQNLQTNIGRVLFGKEKTQYIEDSKFRYTMREMKTDFGILPYPMLDGEQDGYYSLLGFAVTMFSIPNSVRDADMIIVMNDGIITGIGTHDELLVSNEEYSEIYYSQNDSERKEAR